MSLLPGQRAQLWIADAATGATELVLETGQHIEAPNWSGDTLVVNADGALWRFPLGGALERVEFGAGFDINNDHLVSPDGAFVYVSGRDGHLYEVPWAGGSHRRITPEAPGFKAYLHGISPDGTTLGYIGGSVDAAGAWHTNVHTIPVAGGAGAQLTDDEHDDDGCEIGPDGLVYFNSTRGSDAPGHAQLFTMRSDGGDIRQLTFDERVNWFPHPSPDGARVLYLSYPEGTLGHPANLPVHLRLLGERAPLVELFGGQGTINVPSWSPDSTRFAYVAYPFSGQGP